MPDAKPFTQSDLRRSLVRQGVILSNYADAKIVADAIRERGLIEVIAGKHDGRTVKYGAAYSLVFGERLSLKR